MKKYINPNVEISEICLGNAIMEVSQKPGGTTPDGGGDHGFGSAPKRRPF